jgi:Rrf2 family iron-sulfur cluster assembly transcriptional regulator
MDLAIHEQVGPLTIAEISEKQNISLSYLEQLFADLRKNQLVKGTRGPGGGYRLARPVDQVSVAQIIKAVDDKALEASSEGESYVPFVLWSSLSQKLYDFLDNITLAECINHPRVHEMLEELSRGKHVSRRFAA